MFNFIGRYTLDNLNKLKNLCSKSIGQKMKNKEAVGDDDTLPDDFPVLEELAAEHLAVS